MQRGQGIAADDAVRKGVVAQSVETALAMSAVTQREQVAPCAKAAMAARESLKTANKLGLPRGGMPDQPPTPYAHPSDAAPNACAPPPPTSPPPLPLPHAAPQYAYGGCSSAGAATGGAVAR
jgi:hypothetical protein